MLKSSKVSYVAINQYARCLQVAVLAKLNELLLGLNNNNLKNKLKYYISSEKINNRLMFLLTDPMPQLIVHC